MTHAMRMLALAGLCGMAFVAGARQAPSPRDVIETGREKMLAVLRDPRLAAAEKASGVGRIAEERIDFEIMSRLALGPAFGELSEVRQEQFKTEFRKHVLSVISKATERYSGQEAVVGAVRSEPRGDQMVTTRITGKKGGVEKEIARVEFRLRQRDGRWGVIDLSIQGISLAGGFRAQFEAVMKDGGADKLLQLLHEKNTARQSAAAAK